MYSTYETCFNSYIQKTERAYISQMWEINKWSFEKKTSSLTFPEAHTSFSSNSKYQLKCNRIRIRSGTVPCKKQPKILALLTKLFIDNKVYIIYLLKHQILAISHPKKLDWPLMALVCLDLNHLTAFCSGYSLREVHAVKKCRVQTESNM